MSIANKKDKKFKSKGGPTKKSYLNKIAGQGQGNRSFAQYMKYGDIPESDVFTGTASLSGHDFTDSPSTNQAHYSRAVKTGHGKSYYRFQGKLYKTTNSSGTTYAEVKV